jgi:hypothetical protein
VFPQAKRYPGPIRTKWEKSKNAYLTFVTKTEPGAGGSASMHNLSI